MTPEQKLLDQLLGTYRQTHQRYLRQLEESQRWLSFLIVLVLFGPVIVGVIYLVDGYVPIAGFYKAAAIVMVPAIGSVIWIVRRNLLRSELQRLKRQLDGIGYLVVCDLSERYRPELKLIGGVVIESSTDIVFAPHLDVEWKKYDHLFPP